ncbi:MAG: chromate transporter [Candidatus Izemoplasma sp.]|nr:chromate transporter [Candidatus Izemoplasma sp.]
MALLRLFLIFFKVGLFTVGGGLAAIPLLQAEVLERGWLTQTQFTDMIAVSESTPGPIGVNISTYVGYSQFGIIGSIIATFGIVLPSMMIIMLIAKYVLHYRDSHLVSGIFTGLRPAVTGLILAAAGSIAMVTLIDIDAFKASRNILDLISIKAWILFFIFLFATNKWKHHPIFYIIIAGVIGIFIF